MRARDVDIGQPQLRELAASKELMHGQHLRMWRVHDSRVAMNQVVLIHEEC